MQRAIRSCIVTFGAIWLCLAANLFAQPPQIGQNLASLVYLDGHNVIENAEYNLKTDQLLSFETYDLLPNSTIKFSALQKGIPIVTKTYETNEKGAMKDVLFFPKARAQIKCILIFQTINGEEKRLVFHLKPV